jgi:histidine triad (HIT) family protein
MVASVCYDGCMEECIFCNIANSNDPAQLVWQNGVAAAFKSISPTAPVHLLLVPKRHIADIDHLDDPVLAGQLIMAAREVVESAGIKGGWQMRANNGASAGQTVGHLHFHLRGGIKMAE